MAERVDRPRTRELGREERFATVPTVVKDISLLVEPGAQLQMPRETIEALAGMARSYIAAHEAQEEARAVQASQREALVAILEDYPDFRGLRMGNERLSLVWRVQTTWNRGKLRTALKEEYPRYVRETWSMRFNLPTEGIDTPTGRVTTRDIFQVVQEYLETRGVKPAQRRQILEPSYELAVDEKGLQRQIDRGAVKLPEGTRTDQVTWAVTTRTRRV